MFGFLNINKPSGISSHKVIAILRKILGIKQIGHAGTLDPLANGVLPVAVGKASKLIDYLPSDKRYIAGLEFGKISDTYDIEGTIEQTGYRKITLEEIQNALVNLRGEVSQVPPAYSAVHYNGKRLYELAREGKIPDDIPARKINIYKNEVLDFDFEHQILKLDIACSKGTYIRTIINDLGQMTGAGAIMCSLTRVEAGGMKIDNSIELTEDISKEFIINKLISPENILNMEVKNIDDSEFKIVINGNKIKKSSKDGEILLKYNDKIIALAIAQDNIIQPKKVLL